MTVRDTAVQDSATGVRIERGAGEVTADGVRLSGGTDGIVALSATTGVVVRNLTAQGVDRAAVRTASPGLRIQGGRITGGSTGIDALSATTVSGTMISDVEEGVRARAGAQVHVADVDVSALTTGVNAAAGSPIVLVGSRLDALQAVRGEVRLDGDNQLSLPPLNLLGAIGVPLVLLALILEQLHAFRQSSFGGFRRRLPPVCPADAVRSRGLIRGVSRCRSAAADAVHVQPQVVVLVGLADPGHAQPAGRGLRALVGRAGQGEHLVDVQRERPPDHLPAGLAAVALVPVLRRDLPADLDVLLVVAQQVQAHPADDRSRVGQRDGPVAQPGLALLRLGDPPLQQLLHVAEIGDRLDGRRQPARHGRVAVDGEGGLGVVLAPVADDQAVGAQEIRHTARNTPCRVATPGPSGSDHRIRHGRSTILPRVWPRASSV